MTIENEKDVVFKDIFFIYADDQEPSLVNINLVFDKGLILLVIGTAGAGKTTLCKYINGLILHFFGGKLI